MTILITFICVTLSVAVGATTFIYGRQIGYIQRDAEVKAGALKEQQAQIEQLQLEYIQLETQYKHDQRDNQRGVRPGGWDPGQLSGRE